MRGCLGETDNARCALRIRTREFRDLSFEFGKQFAKFAPRIIAEGTGVLQPGFDLRNGLTNHISPAGTKVVKPRQPEFATTKVATRSAAELVFFVFKQDIEGGH